MNHLNMYCFCVPDFNQPKNQAQADSEWGVDECGRMHVGHQEIADGAGYKWKELGEAERKFFTTFRVSSPTEALLDPESGSSYDDSEFSDDDDAEYLVTSAKIQFSRIYQTMRSYHLRPDRENYKIVLNLLEGLEHKGHCVTMDNYYNSPALARCRGFDCLGTERLTRKNIPEDVKR
ncbi:hypothetical protein EVAR_8500_1 [Eumeta japonica]|uniref:PiggyBac transposable element-derived protein domain-containing protein n=1 Tax=Eumeta variegata TaxID=151549 RepID=A0A4C1XK25_EUMVA|nr:hypothetical protein EVAR_8500_1 [Eumeta japonica]